jgi:hypothetical protein
MEKITGSCFAAALFKVMWTSHVFGMIMCKDINSKSTDDDLAKLQQRIVQLEGALSDYAQRFGLTERARKALTCGSPPEPHQ